MKPIGGTTSCFGALLLTLASTSAAIRTLNSIEDLKTIDFGQNVPMESLALLHWFANAVDIGYFDVSLTFDPNSHDYGSHHYRNHDGLLEPLMRHSGYQYYTLGNIKQDGPRRLPDHILHPRQVYAGNNRARIIVRARERNFGQAIDDIYITQHYGAYEHQGTRYNLQHTYRVSTNLLRQLREFPLAENGINTLRNLTNRYGGNTNDAYLRHIRNTWDSLACLGLLLAIVGQRSQFYNQSGTSHLHSGTRTSTHQNFESNQGNDLAMILFGILVFAFLLLIVAVKNYSPHFK